MSGYKTGQNGSQRYDDGENKGPREYREPGDHEDRHSDREAIPWLDEGRQPRPSLLGMMKSEHLGLQQREMRIPDTRPMQRISLLLPGFFLLSAGQEDSTGPIRQPEPACLKKVYSDHQIGILKFQIGHEDLGVLYHGGTNL
jgi:hypothetical protein